MYVCRYGLSGSVWSGDEDRAAEMANQLQAGQIFTNSHGGRLDVPFGGFKQSGIGRVFGQVGVPCMHRAMAVVCGDDDGTMVLLRER